MSNIQNISIATVMQGLSKAAPVALVICAMLSFAAVSIFLVDYYTELFKVRFGDNAMQMAILVSLIQELVRFVLLISSVRDFSDKKPLNGWLGLFGSGVLVWHDISVCNSLALMWDSANPDSYSYILHFLILIGLLLEIRLVLTVGNSRNKKVSNASKNGVPNMGKKVVHAN